MLFRASRKPLLLLAGDSISVGYTEPLRQLLVGFYRIERAPKAVTSAQIISGIDAWIVDHRPKIIFFNCGLHDLWRREDGARVVELEDYRANIRAIAERASAAGAVPIFATTTPLPTPSVDANRKPCDVEIYNRAAAQALYGGRAIISDLHLAAMSMPRDHWETNGIHPSATGYRLLARRAAGDILTLTVRLTPPRRASGSKRYPLYRNSM